MNKIKDDEVNNLVLKYKGGESAKSLAYEYGVCSTTINSYLHKAGVKIERKGKLTSEIIIKRIKAKYGADKFDCSEVKFTKVDSQIKVFCNDCELFFTPSLRYFLSKSCQYGCPSCVKKHSQGSRKIKDSDIGDLILAYQGGESLESISSRYNVVRGTIAKYIGEAGINTSNTLTTDILIKKSKDKYGPDKFDYSETVFVDGKTPVKIFCNDCQLFFYPKPYHHIYDTTKFSCTSCSRKDFALNHTYTFDEFEKKARVVHGYKYDYLRNSYSMCSEYLTIFCKGCKEEFNQTGTAHLTGRGCPNCAHRQYGLNQRYFKTWSANMAYILGFYYADGNIMCEPWWVFRIMLHKKDSYILEAMKKELGYEGPLYINEDKNQVGLSIGSKLLVNDIVRLGGKPNKTLDVDFPYVPTKYLPDFIRGVFDGDGSVFYINSSKSYFSNIVSASESFIFEMKKKIERYISGVHPTIEIRYPKKEHHHILYKIKFSQNDTRRLRDYLYYDDSVMKLDRKYDRFKKAGDIRLHSRDLVFDFSMLEASVQINRWGIMTYEEWGDHKKENVLPDGFPRCLAKVYSSEWSCWKDFMALGRDELIKRLDEKITKSDWVSVSEKLPKQNLKVQKDGVLVLVYPGVFGKYITTGNYNNGSWSVDGDEYTGVTHWRVLPEKPE